MSDGFKLGRIAQEFHTIARSAIEVLNEASPEYSTFVGGIQEQLNSLKSERLIRVAFVGQYSAGKSSIISAMTGRRDIKIDADIATDRATDYEWNGILLTDTPSLYTEREDHDNITYAAIDRSDILVFTITNNLFDDLILQNFIRLAYE